MTVTPINIYDHDKSRYLINIMVVVAVSLFFSASKDAVNLPTSSFRYVSCILPSSL